jgi:hypothetical protein
MTWSGVQAPGGFSVVPRARVSPVKTKPGIRRCAVTRHPGVVRSWCASASVAIYTPAFDTL